MLDAVVGEGDEPGSMLVAADAEGGGDKLANPKMTLKHYFALPIFSE